MTNDVETEPKHFKSYKIVKILVYLIYRNIMFLYGKPL